MTIRKFYTLLIISLALLAATDIRAQKEMIISPSKTVPAAQSSPKVRQEVTKTKEKSKTTVVSKPSANPQWNPMISVEELYEEGIDALNQDNPYKAFPLLSSAAEAGHEEAQYLVGSMLLEGEGCEQNQAEAFRWLRKGAMNGSAMAQFGVAACYVNAMGCDPDFEEAARWFRRAAEQGVPEAQYLLALMTEEGVGTDQSYQEAIRWYKAAARQDYPDACLRLSEMYAEGIGTRQNAENAAKWRTRYQQLTEKE